MEGERGFSLAYYWCQEVCCEKFAHINWNVMQLYRLRREDCSPFSSTYLCFVEVEI
jgi:hypothetical protein